jgi:hypothetical protein
MTLWLYVNKCTQLRQKKITYKTTQHKQKIYKSKKNKITHYFTLASITSRETIESYT